MVKRLMVGLLAVAAAVVLWSRAGATVPSPTSSVSYTCAELGTAYPVPFRFLESSHLVVTTTTAGGVTTTLSRGPDYTVTGAGSPSGGSVTLTALWKCPSGTLTIKRTVPLTQPTSLPSNGPFTPKTHETAFDRLAMQMQQLDRGQSDALNAASTAVTLLPILQGNAAAAQQAALDAQAAVSAAATAGSSSLVTATGSTTPRSLAARAADEVNVKDFGATGDGVTDDYAAIQAAVNYAFTNRVGTVFLPSGIYRISDTIRMKSPEVIGFHGAAMKGAGRRYRGEGGFSGTALVPTFSDRAAVRFSVTRQASISDISIIGLNKDWILTTPGLVHKYGGVYTVEGSDPAAWVDPAILAVSPNADSRYAPYAGVQIDALTSQTYLHNIEVTGFVVGIAVAPDGSDGNGDFITIQKSGIIANKYGISVGNTQCRNVTVIGSELAYSYALFTNRTHGLQSGHMDLTVVGSYLGDARNIFSLSTAYSGPVTFVGCYGELIWRLGDLSSISVSSVVTFRDTHIAFTWEELDYVPTDLLVATGSTQSVIFDGGEIRLSRLFTWKGATVDLRGTAIYSSDTWDASDATTARKLASNGAAGFFPWRADAYGQIEGRQVVRARAYANVDAVAAPAGTMIDIQNPESFGAMYESRWGRSHPWPAWTPKATAFGEALNIGVGFSASLPATVTKSGIRFTFDPSAWTTPQRALFGAGDLAIEPTTSNRFWVVSYDGSTNATLELLNNYWAPEGVPSTAVTLSGNSLVFIPTRIFRTSWPNWVDTGSGSATVTNAGRSDGWFGFGAAQIHAGDYLVSGTDLDSGRGARKAVFAAPRKVSSVDEGARTITFDGNALSTTTSTPLNLWMRAP